MTFPNSVGFFFQRPVSVGNQLLQLCTARTAWSESDQAVRVVHSCNSLGLGPLWSDSVIKFVSVLFGKCSTLVATKCWPMETRLPRGDQWKAEKLRVFRRWPISRCFTKSDRAGLFIEHSINFRLNGEHWRAVQFMISCSYHDQKLSVFRRNFWEIIFVSGFLC